MGGALLEGWLQAGLAAGKIAVIEPHPAPPIAALAARGVRLNPDPATLKNAIAIVIAVKPQIADEALPALAPMIGPATVVVSIMAGRTLQFLAGALRHAGALVRAMPNTPAAIGRGITVAVPLHVSETQRDLAHRLLIATGAVEWITDEALMDAVTAVSGSGPAYVFLLAEALAQAGVAAGLPQPLGASCRHLARKCHVARRHHGRSPRCADEREGAGAVVKASHRRRYRALAQACGLRTRRLGTAP
jgi:pyrroline-5-carboxylate reductase